MKFDRILLFENIYSLTRRRQEKQYDMESDKEVDTGDVQDFPEEILEERECENIGEKELELETIFESRDDAFNLNVSLAILETETDEVDAEFLEALTEIEGKKSFLCPNCTKVCKSKGGLTKHTNSKLTACVTSSIVDSLIEGKMVRECGKLQRRIRCLATDVENPIT